MCFFLYIKKKETERHEDFCLFNLYDVSCGVKESGGEGTLCVCVCVCVWGGGGVGGGTNIFLDLRGINR